MDMQALLARYANSKSKPAQPPQPPVVVAKPKHPLHDRLVQIRMEYGEPACSDHNLGILLIIIDQFPNEVLWRLWLEQGGVTDASASTNSSNHEEPSTPGTSAGPGSVRPRVQVWFHAKHPDRVTSAWVRERLVTSFQYRPEWGSLELTKVMVHLLHEATTMAPHINKFCYASESCIPIVSMQTMLQRIYRPPSSLNGAVPAAAVSSVDYHCSWLAYRDTANNGYAARDQFGPLSEVFPEGCVHKASQWVLLSRAHALAVLNLLQRFDSQRSRSSNPQVPPLGEELFTAFSRRVRASDEMFFPCCLAVVGVLNPPSVTMESSNSKECPDEAPGIEGVVSGDGLSSIGRVERLQLTYADWRGQAANPIEYTAFPSPLVQEITGVRPAPSAAQDGRKRPRLGADSYNPGAEGPAVDDTQKQAMFLRKVKFPSASQRSSAAVKLAAPGGSSGAEGAEATVTGSADDGETGLTPDQESFLRAWLPFVLHQPSQGANGGSGQAGEEAAAESWLRRAAELLASSAGTGDGCARR